MSRGSLGRNDPCFCGSGKKYKKCCYPRNLPDFSQPNAGMPSAFEEREALYHALSRQEKRAPRDENMTIASVDVGRTRLLCAPLATYGDSVALPGALAPPTPLQVEAKYEAIRQSNQEGVSEVVVTYTYPELFGFAEVRAVFDADEFFSMPNGNVVSVLDLFRGMQAQMADGTIGTIVGNPERRYELPLPPLPDKNGLWTSRVMGRVKHTADEIVEFRWGGQMVRVTPGHVVWSASRRGWVGAHELYPGEMIQVAGNVVAPVEGARRVVGRIEVFGIEVEYFHNYFVGTGDNAMLVHNGPECLVRPKDAEGNPLPYGFKSAEEYRAFTAKLKSGLPEGTQPLFQGSSVTGTSFKTGEPFDVGRKSDFDIALVHDETFLQALDLGAKAKDGTRIGPLNQAQMEALGLLNVQQELAAMAGRPVKFMLFDSTESALQRPSIWVR